jgi:hypothetical protein
MPPHDLSNSVISRAAQVVKNMYRLLRCRAQRVVDYNPPDRKYSKYWRNTAILCIQHQFNPGEFVEIQFQYVRPFPELTQLTSSGAVERYRKYANDYAASFLSEFNIQLQTFERMVALGKDAKLALLDEDQQFDPLFIYAAAESMCLGDLVQAYEERALARYLTSVHYDQVYRDAIPDKFRQKAKEVWEGVSAQRLD